MSESSDLNELHSQVIFLKMRGKSTEELISIWTEYNQKVYSKEEFEAIEKILQERIGKVPPQRVIYKDPYKTREKKKTWAEQEPTDDQYFLSPAYLARRKEAAIIMAVIIFFILTLACFVLIAPNWF
jgi:hypothetical protein